MRRKWFSSLKGKMALVFGAIILISILGCCVLVYFVASPIIEKAALERAQEANARVGNAIESFFRTADKIGMQISADATIQKVLTKSYEATGNRLYYLREDQNDVFKRLESFRSILPGIKGIFIRREDGYTFYDHSRNLTQESIEGNFRERLDEYREAGRYAYVTKPYFTNYQASPARYAVSVMRRIPDLDKLTRIKKTATVGTLMMEVDIQSLADEQISTNKISESDYFIAAGGGEIIYASAEPLPEKIKSSVERVMEADGVAKLNCGGEKVLFFRSDVRYTGWSVVNYVSEREMLHDLMYLRGVLIAIGALFILMAMAAAFAFSHRIVVPIEQIRKMLSLISEGQFGKTVSVQTRDELQALAEGYNTMSVKLAAQIDEIYQSGERKRRAEIVALQSQINPHFIYNTLETIKQMASLQQNLGIATMADSLIRLLRSAAKYEDGTITIAQEITLLRAYIYIQETRYLGKVSIRVDVQPGLEPYETLNLLLQPVVENAIFHGIVPKDGAGTVYVDVRAVGDRIVYTVKDDGVGMGEAMSDKLLDVSDEQAFKKLGLANVNRRIRIFFGDEYGLSIESERNAGTTVRIEIPKRLHEEKTEGEKPQSDGERGEN